MPVTDLLESDHFKLSSRLGGYSFGSGSSKFKNKYSNNNNNNKNNQTTPTVQIKAMESGTIKMPGILARAKTVRYNNTKNQWEVQNPYNANMWDAAKGDVVNQINKKYIIKK